MKIVMVSHYFASHRGGVEIVADELYRGLTERGHEVVWLAGDVTPPPDAVGRSRAVGLPVMNFVEKRIGLPLPIPGKHGLSRIRAEIGNADLLLLHDCLYLSNIVAFLTARRCRIPIVLVQHTRFFPNGTIFENALLWLATRVVTRPMLASAQQVVFVSETSRQCFARVRFRRQPETIFNGIDTGLFRTRRVDEAQADVRRAYGLPEAGKLILFVGRFVEKKGIAVMKRLVELRPDWTWVFAGWGPLDPGKWNAPNVRVLSDLQGNSMAGVYRACDLLVLPSSGEGFPLVIQEALASGLPVVCGDETRGADPAMERVVKGAAVYLGDEGKTAGEFLRAIDEALEGEAESNGLVNRRRDFAISRYSWGRSIEKYIEIISRLTAGAAAQVGQMQRVAGAAPR